MHETDAYICAQIFTWASLRDLVEDFEIDVGASLLT
jgi:hypothetical protein